ncbi:MULTISPECIES: hypothetical protein [Leptolyngbya]|jgi:hypothetical protein|uniref:hypothetical protein n=1 Tax=Leptolyngbya TaxID=47251 RepID=UPI000361D3E0|nr:MULTISPECIES: hypothetical protein [Leptolyngbya]MBD2371102.1 hypothetical protein [Leptolyngbya sp. FACHB-161]MBD2377570.1 hypothetical protein [Leptolyngbya sp. FACHB-238]MBD2402023.1 hypothetical protein [Leptolyngbya sp. FACHB-239]MBD2408542.1 hypothetical protein [Leptolyngbya sp. FACHB-402]BAS60442.1 hypothetical protein LBWT_Y0300 [Leptolyngbya boryana IAM M-101]
MPFQLPQNFNVNLPNFQELAESAIGTPESGFAPTEVIARTSDTDREQHAQIYREQMNTIDNLKDGLRLVNNVVTAGVEATVLGQTLLKYQTGLEKVRNEGVKLQKAQTQTAISQAELSQLQLKLGFETDKLPILNVGYQAKLQGLQVQAEMAQRETEKLMIERDTRYPIVDVQAIAA